jgi:RNA polymerase sigma-70 factor (ECF subfamily)
MSRIDDGQIARLYRRAQAERWGVSIASFAETLERSVAQWSAGRAPGGDVERYLSTLHVEDLALACACAAGHDGAWDHFMIEYRPGLYRAADALDRTGGARELADALYAELYGLKERDGARATLFRYYHGRSSLATWLRAVLTQRHIDHVRAGRRLAPLPEDDTSMARGPQPLTANSDHQRFQTLMHAVLSAALAALAPRDRLRLGCYYAQGMTLAQIGRLLREHEGTVSRHLARTRRTIREGIEARLRRDHGFDEAELEECFVSVMDDVGSLDLGEMLGAGSTRKKSAVDRSTNEGMP